MLGHLGFHPPVPQNWKLLIYSCFLAWYERKRECLTRVKSLYKFITLHCLKYFSLVYQTPSPTTAPFSTFKGIYIESPIRLMQISSIPTKSSSFYKWQGRECPIKIAVVIMVSLYPLHLSFTPYSSHVQSALRLSPFPLSFPNTPPCPNAHH